MRGQDTSSLTMYTTDRTDHPRSRGLDTPANVFPVSSTGSPPLAGTKGDCASKSRVSVRNTPAGGEET